MISSARARRLAVVAATVLGLSVATAAPALADTRVFKDGKGDTWNVASQTPKKSSGHPIADLRKLRIKHSARRVVITAHMQDLKKAGDAIGMGLGIDTPGDVIYGSETGASARNWRPSASWSASDGSTCTPKAAISFRRDTIQLTVPTRCIGNPDWVRVQLAAFWIKNQDKAFYDDATGKKIEFAYTRRVSKG